MQKVNYLCDKEINPKHWYILILRNSKPLLCSRFFKTEKLAKNFLKINNLKGLEFIIIRGNKAINYELKLSRKTLDKLTGKTLVHYIYPSDRISKQDKKSFRTKSRRWKREFGSILNNHTDFKTFRR